eukprot:TRINITY_DN3930_c0_g1_i1.p1 TRINITY_DN3930_c0_g1~~TRINITY_DN3930_c0_g1_i1.p1  ORF type:complete len:314 (-),score=83.46 TRINITY_DN3930_c0_g1_i1:290-1231(-)
MARHAKNNTASAVFTYYERSLLKYGTQKQRLGRDSMKHFDDCCLCLQPVCDPLSCLKGHLFCKECIYENLLAQKKDMKRNLKLYAAQQIDQKEKFAIEEAEKKVAEIAAFGKSECGILPDNQPVFRPKLDEDAEADKPPPPSMSKQLVAYDPNKPPTMIANQGDADKEKLQLNSFWVPSLTPSAAPQLMEKPVKETYCVEGNHPVRLKKLIKVKFTIISQIEKSDKNNVANAKYCCPVCRKTLTDAPKAVLLKTCGHVMCLGCCEKFRDEKICTVCDMPFRIDDIIRLQSGGTGFAGHDEKIVAKKEQANAWV